MDFLNEKKFCFSCGKYSKDCSLKVAQIYMIFWRIFWPDFWTILTKLQKCCRYFSESFRNFPDILRKVLPEILQTFSRQFADIFAESLRKILPQVCRNFGEILQIFCGFLAEIFPKV